MKYDYMQIITLPNRKGKYLALVKGNEMRVIARFISYGAEIQAHS